MYNNFLAKQPERLIEETAPGIDSYRSGLLVKSLTRKTWLYYYGRRYLDPKYSRWLSGNSALGDYIPKAPIDDEAKKHNENLPGMGGVFNIVNLHLYHYAGNNPVKYIDPDGKQQVHPGVQALNNYFDQVARTNSFVEESISFIYDNILTKGSSFGQYIDKVFYKGAGEKKLLHFI
nr:hypothetical protein [Treponema pedis]